MDYQNYSEWKAWEGNFTYLEKDRIYYENELSNLVSPGGKIIEIGFGNGGLMNWARQRGCTVVGVEIQENLLIKARELGYDVYQNFLEIDQALHGTVDGIIALDVFEHLDQATIAAFLQKSAQCLRPGGRLLIRVPNALSPFGRAHQYGDWTHVSAITPARMEQVAIGTGMRVAAVRNEARITFGTLPRRIGQKLRYVLRQITSGALNFIYNMGTTVLDKNIIIELVKQA